MSKPAPPDGDDLKRYIQSLNVIDAADFDAAIALMGLDDKAAAAWTEFQERSAWTPYLKDANDVTRYYNPPGPNRGGGTRGGGYELELNAGLLEVTSVTVGWEPNGVWTVSLVGSPTGGTFTLSFRGRPTSALAYNASAAAVQTALLALSSVGSGNVAVTGSNGGPWTVTFQSALINAPSPLDADGALLTGGTSPDVFVSGGNGTDLEQDDDYWLLDGGGEHNWPAEGAPAEYMGFAVSRWGGPKSIRIVGKWGKASALKEHVWEKLLHYGASLAWQQLMLHTSSGGLTGLKQGPNEWKWASDADKTGVAVAAASWKTEFDDLCDKEKRPSALCY